MISDNRRREIVAAFQASFKRDNRDVLKDFSLEEFVAADEMIGARDLNEGYRTRLRNRISFLSAKQERNANLRTRWTDRILGILVGVGLTVLGILLSVAWGNS